MNNTLRHPRTPGTRNKRLIDRPRGSSLLPGDNHPPAQAETAFQRRLGYYLDLDISERELVAGLEAHPVHRERGTTIYSRGEIADLAWIVQAGWLFGHSSLPDGSRSVVRVFLPGDLVGLGAVSMPRYAFDVESLSNAIVCPFPKAMLAEIFTSLPSLGALLFAQSAIEEVAWIDRLRVTTRMKPAARVAYFLLDIITRLRRVDPTTTNQLEIPVSQYVIGDAVGLTNVTICRALHQLIEQGWISKVQGGVELHDEAALRALCDYEDRYEAMDLSWLP